jgi:hypothetical protein
MPHNVGGDGHSFSQQTVMHFSSIPGENGQPLVYQASSSTKTGPGGVRFVISGHDSISLFGFR